MVRKILRKIKAWAIKKLIVIYRYQDKIGHLGVIVLLIALLSIVFRFTSIHKEGIVYLSVVTVLFSGLMWQVLHSKLFETKIDVWNIVAIVAGCLSALIIYII